MNMTRIAGAVMAGGLLLAACGDDGGGSGAGSNEYSDAVADAIRSDPEVEFSDDEIDCLSRELVEAVGGPSAFEDAGVEPADLEGDADLSDSGLDLGDEEAEAVASSFGKCDIDLTEAFLQSLPGEVPDDVKSCIEDNLSEDTFADLFAQALVTGGSGDELPPELLQDLTACLGG